MSHEEEKRKKAADDAQGVASPEKGGVTRRELLRGFGGAALVAGASRFPAAGQSSPGTTAPAPAAMPPRPNLPPGLYAPSVEHLIHELSSDSLYHAVPRGSETDYARPLTGEYKPIFFSGAEFLTVRQLVGIILGFPEAEDPGAAAGGAESALETTARFIDLDLHEARRVREVWQTVSPAARTVAIHYYGRARVMELEDTNPSKAFREGLAWLDQTAQARHGLPFQKLTSAQQAEILETISDERPVQGAGSRFFRLLKNETIRGYYTSRPGLKELNDPFNTFHVASPGCPSGQTAKKS